MKHALTLLLPLLFLGGCISVNAPGGAPARVSAQNAPGHILYGADTVIECRYHRGCRTVRP